MDGRTAARQCPFLEWLPLEMRLEIYKHLLVHPPLTRNLLGAHSSRPLHTAILRVCRQIYAEASGMLYGENTFLAHQTMLTSFPRLRVGYSPVKEASAASRIRRYHMRVRLDCDPAYDRDAVTTAFTGVDELTLEVWQAAFLAADHGVLKLFEGVREVGRVKIYGSTTGFDDYVLWLAGVMESHGTNVTGLA
ncbi:hypothetical protein ACHAQA_008386 [Verticillium albo-atrum]